MIKNDKGPNVNKTSISLPHKATKQEISPNWADKSDCSYKTCKPFLYDSCKNGWARIV